MPFPWEVSPFDPLNGAGSPFMYPGLEPPQPPQISGIQPPVMPGPAPTFIGDLGPVQPSAVPQWTSPEPTSPLSPEDVTSLPPPPGIAAGVDTPRQPPIAMLGTPSLPATDPGGLSSSPAPVSEPMSPEPMSPLDQPPGIDYGTGGSPFGGSWMNPFEPQVGGVPGPPMDLTSAAQKGSVQGGGGPATQPQNPAQKLLSGLAGIAAPQVPAAQRVATPAAPQGFRAPGRGNAVELMAALGIRGRQPPPYDLPSTFGRALRG